MNTMCENCCEAFVGTYEGYYVSRDNKTMRVCKCCKNEYVMMGWIGIKVPEKLLQNETENTCPICLRDYDRHTLLKDGPQNSDCDSRCTHWCCIECWNEIYNQQNDKDTCPICRCDITEWLKSHYEDEDPKTKPCSCGCDVIGGSCEKGAAIDNGEEQEEEDEDK